METIMISVDRFTKSAQEIAERAADIMQRYNHHQIDAEHMLLALLEQPQGVVSQLLEFLKVDANALSEGLDTILRTGPKGDIVEVGPGQIAITPRVVRILDLANEEATRLKDEHISTEHIFLEILSEANTSAVRLLEGAGLTRDRVCDAIQQMRG
jgi:ATPases with chaperone activity, ATP-binding subunit